MTNQYAGEGDGSSVGFDGGSDQQGKEAVDAGLPSAGASILFDGETFVNNCRCEFENCTRGQIMGLDELSHLRGQQLHLTISTPSTVEFPHSVPQWHLLDKLTEEGLEVGQRAFKAKLFGFDEAQSGQDQDNRERLAAEIDDFFTMAVWLGFAPKVSLEKITKVEKYYNYALAVNPGLRSETMPSEKTATPLAPTSNQTASLPPITETNSEDTNHG